MKTKIYGASDDLIEIEGPCSEEFGCYDHKKPIKIQMSDGTKATIYYDDEWKITVPFAGSKYHSVIPSVGDDNEHVAEHAKGCSSYSDVLVMDEGIEWVKIGRKIFRAVGG